MASDESTVPAPPQPTIATAVPDAASLDERWAAWQAKGAAHDRESGRTWQLSRPYCRPPSSLSSTYSSGDEDGYRALAAVEFTEVRRGVEPSQGRRW
jgi:hypothetical protein